MPSTEPSIRPQSNAHPSDRPVHVAVGVIQNGDGRILIARRPEHVHQGGLWEFPGGKVESGESARQALRRELSEELDIQLEQADPLIKISHRYPDRTVLLDVWRIASFTGQPWGCEGQEVRWVEPDELGQYDFPEANRPIISAAVLPPGYAILEGREEAQVMANLQLMFERRVKLIQLRLKTFASVVPGSLLERITAECVRRRIPLLVNSALICHQGFSKRGVHLTSRDLMSLRKRPEDCQWVAASCHNQQELQQAEKIGVDFVVLAPVLRTRSHPQTEPLGWQKFAELTWPAKVPVYALGGLCLSDLEQARQAGAQGIAGISAFQ